MLFITKLLLATGKSIASFSPVATKRKCVSAAAALLDMVGVPDAVIARASAVLLAFSNTYTSGSTSERRNTWFTLYGSTFHCTGRPTPGAISTAFFEVGLTKIYSSLIPVEKRAHSCPALVASAAAYTMRALFSVLSPLEMNLPVATCSMRYMSYWGATTSVTSGSGRGATYFFTILNR